MEDNLIFPIGFDIKNIQKQWADAEKEITRVIQQSDFKIKVSIDDSSIQKALDVLSRLEKMGGGLIKPSTTAAVVKATVDSETKAKERLALAEEKVNTQKAKTLAVTQRMNMAMEKHNSHLSRQRGILNGMPQMLNSYVSLLGAWRLTKNISEVTAEFELQRVALTAIIQNKAKADQLFGQVVELGIQSPFQIRELISYTKQLAAYRVETDRLFETTSRLADISAGLGVDMNRLILAYGQVRAASVLRGQELRQFTEAGIPLVDLLAKEFTKLNGVMTTTGDVFEMISKRQVPFSIIEKLFEDMTNAGGVFYNMQKIQAETLKGVWSNLRDAYDKMFMQMGNANMGLLKGFGLGLKSLADNWEAVLGIVEKGAIIYGVYKLAVIANTAAQGKELTTTLASIKAGKIKEANLLRQQGAYMTLTAAEQMKIKSAHKLNATDLQAMVSSGSLTKIMALRMIALKKLTYAQEQQLMTSLKISPQEAMQAASAGKLRVLYIGLTASVRTFTAAMYASIKAMLANPYTWIFAGVSAIVSIYSKFAEKNRLLKESIEGVNKEAVNFAADLKEGYNSIKDSVEKALVKGAGEDTIKSANNLLSTLIEKNESLRPLLAERLKGLDSEADKLRVLLKLYNEIDLAKGGGIFSPSVLPEAISSAQGVFGKDIVGLTDKMNEQFSAVSKRLGELSKNGVKGGREFYNQFSELVKKFKEGELSINEFSQRIEKLRSIAPGFFDETTLELIRTTKKVKDNFGEIVKYIQATTDQINGQKINWGADKFGLSQNNFNELQVNLNLIKELWFRTNSDIKRDILENVWGSYFQSPKAKTGPVSQLATYSQAFNKFIQDKKINVMQPIKEGSDKTAEEIGEAVSEALDAELKLQKRINSEISNGNKVREKELSQVNENVRQYQLLAKFVGVQSKESNKQAKTKAEILSNEVDLIKDAYQQYVKLSEKMDGKKAQQIISERFGGQTKFLKLAFTAEDFVDQIGVALNMFSTSEYGGKNSRAYWDAWDVQSDVSLDDLNSKIKNNLDRLGKEIVQTQKANDFYEKLMGITSDSDLSRKLTLQVTGFDIGDLRAKLRDQIVEAIGGKISIPPGKLDLTQLRSDLAGSDIGKTQMALIDKYIEAYVENESDAIQKLYSNLDKYQSYEDKKTEILRKASELRKNAIDTGQISQLPAIDTMVEKQLADLEYENFKTTDMYLQLFGDLDRISSQSLAIIRQRIVDMSTTIGSSLSPTNAKELLGKIDDLNNEIIKRDPFKVWAESLRKIEALKSTISYMEASESSPKGLNPAVWNVYTSLVLPKLKKELKETQDNSKKARKEAVKELATLKDSAVEVVDGVSAIFEEFGEGADSIAGKSLDVLKEITNGVIKAMTIASDTAGESISATEKASVVLAIISTALKVGLMIYNMFSKEQSIQKQIESLTMSLNNLEDIYSKLSNVMTPDQMNRLKDELKVRKELVEITQKELLSKKYNAKTVDQLNKYIFETNKMLLYQADLYKVIESDMNNIAKSAKARVENLREQNAIMTLLVNNEIKRGKKADIEKILELQQNIAENEVSIAYAFLDSLNEVTGDIFSSLQSSVADALMSSWEAGENGALAYRDTVNDVMRDVIKNIWKVNILPKLLQPVMKEIYSALGLDPKGKVKPGTTPDYNISKTEANRIGKAISDSEKNVTSAWSSLEDILNMFPGANNDNLTGITKAIGSMSEETALTMSGYLNSLLYYSVSQYNIQMKIYEELQKRVASTSVSDTGSLMQLEALQGMAIDKLNQIAQNTEKSAKAAEALLDFLNKASMPGGKKLNVYLN